MNRVCEAFVAFCHLRCVVDYHSGEARSGEFNVFSLANILDIRRVERSSLQSTQPQEDIGVRQAFGNGVAAETSGMLDKDASSVRELRTRSLRKSFGFSFSFFTGYAPFLENFLVKLAEGRFARG
jgi:hypothetical protein